MKVLLGIMCGAVLLVLALFIFIGLVVQLPLAIGFSPMSWHDIFLMLVVPSLLMICLAALNGLAIRSLMTSSGMGVFVALAVVDVGLAGFSLLAGLGIGHLRPGSGQTVPGLLEAAAAFLLVKACLSAVMAVRTGSSSATIAPPG